MKLKSKIVNHQLQTDDYNCGVFVCYFYATMIENKFPNFDIKIDIDDYRTHIKEIFKSNSYIKACCSCGKTLSIISNVFKNVKKFDCGHKFHISCINQCFNDCQVCESNHFWYFAISFVFHYSKRIYSILIFLSCNRFALRSIQYTLPKTQILHIFWAENSDQVATKSNQNFK